MIKLNERYSNPVLIGSGGMAEVYRAHDQRLDRDVAIKVVRPETSDKPLFRQRFKREIKTLTSLQHPNIIQIYDCSAEEDSTYYVMALLEGKTLAEYVASGSISINIFSAVVNGLLSALSCAHDKGVIHRDIKPENVFISESGDPVLMDFGIAGAADDDATCLTQAGSFIGTYMYASPEQLDGDKLTPAADIYSLGLVIYAMLCGGLPYSGTMTKVIQQKMMQPTPELPAEHPVYRTIPALKTVLARMLAKNLDQRYTTCDEILNDLQSKSALPSAGMPGDGNNDKYPADSSNKLDSGSRIKKLNGMSFGRFLKAIKACTAVAVFVLILFLVSNGKSRINVSTYDAGESIAAVNVDGIAYSFNAVNLFDDNPATSWQPKERVGSWFSMRLPEKGRYELRMINGYAWKQGDYDWYYGNNRVRSIDVITDEGTRSVSLQDHVQSYQSLGSYSTDYFHVRITGIYPGQRWNDTAISDVAVFRD